LVYCSSSGAALGDGPNNQALTPTSVTGNENIF
jgi:hypothetical protein